MKKLISGGQYARGLGARFGAFALITFAFPFFVYGLIEMTGARGVGGASGALALIVGVSLKPYIYLLFAYSTLRISLDRAYTIGISPMIGLCIPLLIVADFSFGVTFGSFWAVGFSLGILHVPVPASLLTGLIAVVVLSLLRDIEETKSERLESLYRIWRGLLFVSLGLGLVGVLAFLSLIILFGMEDMNPFLPLLRAMFYLRASLIYPYGLLLAFAVASTALILESRRPTIGGASTGGGSGSATRNQAPLFGRRSN